MSTTQSAYDWLRARVTPSSAPPVREDDRGPEREHDARAEIDRLRDEIETLVDGPNADPRDAVDTALNAVTRLQVVTANLDACNPPKGDHLGRALQAFADRRLQGHADAIERGMTYTADNTLRLLRTDRKQ
jgi:hypothetical protein